MVPIALAMPMSIIVALVAIEPALIKFEDIATGSGLAFRYENGSRGLHDLPEIMGGGVALIDGDNDGLLDLFLCNGGPIAPGPGTKTRDDSPCRFFRNLGGGKFRDETAAAGAPGPSYAMGAAVGDFDNDGRDDLFITGWGNQGLYRNVGGRFEDVTERAGVLSSLWSTSAAWADLDADGDLDLVVAAYLDYKARIAPYCAAPDGKRDYCGPEDFEAQPDLLYRNNGDGTFTEVSKSSGFVDRDGRGLGVIVCDLVGDHRPDIYIANDGTACRLWENLGGLRFQEVGRETGTALDRNGEAPAGMGVAVGDFLGTGETDLVVTNFFNRSTLSFKSVGRGLYRDASDELGLNSATRQVNGFGVALADFDGDGFLDLIQANGHVLDRDRLGTPFAMRATLLRNNGVRFVDASASAGAWFANANLGRGLAVGDIDRDGKPDVVIASLDAEPALLRNTSEAEFVAVELVGAKGRQPFGSRLRATIDGRVLTRELPGGGSYLSSSERLIYLPMSMKIRGNQKYENFEVTWPSGRVERFDVVLPSKRVRLKEGEGKNAS